MTKLEILRSALSARIDEVEQYQINIDNYARAIEKIEAEYKDKPAMLDFKKNLSDLLESSETEQLKAIIIRDVIADQISELEES